MFNWAAGVGQRDFLSHEGSPLFPGIHQSSFPCGCMCPEGGGGGKEGVPVLGTGSSARPAPSQPGVRPPSPTVITELHKGCPLLSGKTSSKAGDSPRGEQGGFHGLPSGGPTVPEPWPPLVEISGRCLHLRELITVLRVLVTMQAGASGKTPAKCLARWGTSKRGHCYPKGLLVCRLCFSW